MKTEQLLGRRIRELRKARNLTQEQFGERTGINYKYLGAVERGQENPTVKVLEKIARVLRVDLRDLFAFDHLEQDSKTLKRRIAQLIEGKDQEKLQKAAKLLSALLE
ncbi:MAG: helix-turn-helix transcriptional regulator [Nitrospirae bacterium]|jgi:transcriptional regulator with XRE-family HTH domain|nr:helix-turn-helix transcriptional regulator [Nitrospirota bacterium]